VVEKPAAVRAVQVAELERAAAGRGRVLSVYHNRRWDGDFLTVRRLVESGRLGEVSTFESRFDRFRPLVRDRWRERPEEGAGTLYDLGSHLVDQALQLFGPPRTVLADLGMQREGALATDYFHLVLGYGRLRAILHGGSLVAEPPLRFAVHGDRGSFLKHGLDPQEDALRAGGRPGAVEWGEEPEERHGTLVTATAEGELARARVPTVPGCYPAYYEAVARAVREGAPPPVTAAEGRLVLEVIEAATLSSRERRVVELPLTPSPA
jgi:scyllo-inositol 2-dehydrogenase (NADP+)